MTDARIGETRMNAWGLKQRSAPRRLSALDHFGLPARLDTATPGWGRFAGHICITLNGEDVTRHCVGFDVRRGLVARQATDCEGRIFIDPVTQKVVVDQFRGKVKVAWK